MRAHKVLALITVAVAACGRAAVQSAAPVPAPVAMVVVPPPAPVESVTVAANNAERPAQDSVAEADSAADQAALSALDELELGKDAQTSRVAANAPPVSHADVAVEAKGMFAASHGGTASTASPTYDIDVETFASHGRVQAYV